MAYVIAEPCIGTKDTACVDACPVDCIHAKKNTTYDDGRPTFDTVPQLYSDPVECIDCGACVPVCPVSAIFVLDDLPEKWKQYYGTERKLRQSRQIHPWRVCPAPSQVVLTAAHPRITSSLPAQSLLRCGKAKGGPTLALLTLGFKQLASKASLLWTPVLV